MDFCKCPRTFLFCFIYTCSIDFIKYLISNDLSHYYMFDLVQVSISMYIRFSVRFIDYDPWNVLDADIPFSSSHLTCSSFVNFRYNNTMSRFCMKLRLRVMHVLLSYTVTQPIMLCRHNIHQQFIYYFAKQMNLQETLCTHTLCI